MPDKAGASRILFVGNSFTSAYGMPDMLAALAASAGPEYALATDMIAAGGLRMRQHWESGELAARLRDRPYDAVVLQANSIETLTAPARDEFVRYGTQLVELVRQHGAEPWLYVTWEYEGSCDWLTQHPDMPASAVHGLIQSGYAALAAETGAERVNVGALWQVLRQEALPFDLYEEDGKHPCWPGSYAVAACMLERFRPGALAKASWRPRSLRTGDCVFLRDFIDRHAALLPARRIGFGESISRR